MSLHQPLPPGVRVLKETDEYMVLHFTLPTPVVELLSQALELAARKTGSDKLGANVAAIAMNCVGEWMAEAEDAYRRAVKGVRDVLGQADGCESGGGGAEAVGESGPGGEHAPGQGYDDPELPR